MKLKHLFAGFTAVAIAACVQTGTNAQSGDEGLAGKPAPSFDLKGTDGKTHTVKSITQNGPAFVVFWKEVCPHNPRASKLFNALYEAYGGKAPLYGIVNANLEGASNWTKQFECKYTFLSDQDKATIKAYQMKASIVTVLIEKDGKVSAIFPGYGNESLEKLNAAMAKVAGSDVKTVDLSAAPKRLTYG